MITAGIDCGAKNTKTVVMKDKQIISYALIPTGFDQSGAVSKSLDEALNRAQISMDKVWQICGTGSGAKSIGVEIKINDIKAIATAANYFFQTARTVIDVGAEEARAASIDETGLVIDFAINEKCAAGTGAFVEAMARALETSIEEMGELSLLSYNPIPMNAQCTIFAESEVVGLIHSKVKKMDISRAIHDAIASRIVGMVRRIGVHDDIVVLGGMALNRGFLSSLSRELPNHNILTPRLSEYGAAVGSAIHATRQN